MFQTLFCIVGMKWWRNTALTPKAHHVNRRGKWEWTVDVKCKDWQSLTQDGRDTSPKVMRETTPMEVGSVLNQTVKVLKAKKTHKTHLGQDWHSLYGERCFPQSRGVEEGCSRRCTGELSRTQTSKSFDSEDYGETLKAISTEEGLHSACRVKRVAQWILTRPSFDLRWVRRWTRCESPETWRVGCRTPVAELSDSAKKQNSILQGDIF